jgi:solute carrier family 25 protein 39/40
MTLYRGWVSTVWRDVPFSMIYWFNYEKLKTFLIRYKHSSVSLNSYETFICGATSGAVAAFITCPLDVVKTHRQVQLGEKDLVNKASNKTVNIIKQIYKVKGFSGLFAGRNLFISKLFFTFEISHLKFAQALVN